MPDSMTPNQLPDDEREAILKALVSNPWARRTLPMQ